MRRTPGDRGLVVLVARCLDDLTVVGTKSELGHEPTVAQLVLRYRVRMPRTPRTSVSVPWVAVLAVLLAFGLTACGGGDEPATQSTDSSTPSPEPGEAKASDPEKSCQAIVGSGAVEDIQAVFDKYKDNNTPFTDADAKKMRDALDELAKAGDNASPTIREDVVKLVADAGSIIDSRAKLEGVGKVATPETVQREIDALCR